MKIFNLMPERIRFPITKPLKHFQINTTSLWQSLLVRLLIRSGLTLTDFDAGTECRRIEIGEDQIVEHLRELRNATRRIYNSEIERIVCGPEAFQMILNGYERRDYLNFGFVAKLRLDGPDGIRIFNIPVQVVSWIEGFALIPKMEIKG